jgi:cytochrome c oxidase cbb3-type subunit 3
MRAAFGAALSIGICLVWASSCGEPRKLPHTPNLTEITDFKTLFNQNCVGCHGQNGMKGPAPRLNDPVYLSIVDKGDLMKVIEEGRPGTTMPAFGRDQGGPLSQKQIQSLVDGMESNWSRKVDFHGIPTPTYSLDKAPAGNAAHGQGAYMKNCMMCHGFGKFKGAAGSIIDPNYLALVSDQGLRTTMITGRLDWGMPDWRSRIPGHPMSDQDMSDVVAWLSSKRPQYAAMGKDDSSVAPGTKTPKVSSSTGGMQSSQEK